MHRRLRTPSAFRTRGPGQPFFAHGNRNPHGSKSVKQASCALQRGLDKRGFHRELHERSSRSRILREKASPDNNAGVESYPALFLYRANRSGSTLSLQAKEPFGCNSGRQLVPEMVAPRLSSSQV